MYRLKLDENIKIEWLWIELIWLWNRPCSKLLFTQQWMFGSHEGQVIFRVAEQLLASQERLVCVAIKNIFGLPHGSTNFPKINGPPPNSGCQDGVMK
jgi:hypothetical protein